MHRNSRWSLRLAAALVVAGVAWACGKGAAPVAGPAPAAPAPVGAAPSTLPPGPAPAECALVGHMVPTRDTLTLGLAEPVDPAHAPVPVNRAERLLFAQVYEPLVRLDCAGALRPALAAEWSSGDGGSTWVLTLRPDAHFADGSPVRAADVVQSWRGRPANVAARVAVSALGERRVEVTLTVPSPEGPVVLARPAYAVTRARPGAWPLGTGPYQPDPATRVVTGAVPVLLLRRAAGADPRDLLDGGADLLVTDDPTVLAYARPRTDLTVVALPWDRRYVLATPAGTLGALPLTAGEQAALAQDAVRVEARPAGGLRCDSTTAAPPAPDTTATRTRPMRIVYPRGDAVARDLAARLVALGRTGPGGRAVGLGALDLEAALHGGHDAAVVGVTGAASDACAPLASWGRGLTLLPLVDTRAAAVLRRGAAAPIVDADGTLRWPGSGGSALQ